MIALQPFTRDDIPRLTGWIDSEAALIQWSGQRFSYPLEPSAFEAYLQEAEADPHEHHLFNVVAQDNGEVIGHVELIVIAPHRRQGHICRVLIAPKARQGKGYGTAVMRRIAEMGFRELGLKKISLNVIIFNLAAIACYKKVGFTVEKVMEENLRIGEKKWSSYHMALTEDAWQDHLEQDG